MTHRETHRETDRDAALTDEEKDHIAHVTQALKQRPDLQEAVRKALAERPASYASHYYYASDRFKQGNALPWKLLAATAKAEWEQKHAAAMTEWRAAHPDGARVLDSTNTERAAHLNL